MKLPQASQANVPRAKVEDYLLNPGHPVGRDKARFFFHFGFRREDWRALAAALQRHAQENEAIKASEDNDGATWLVEGPLATPAGRAPLLRPVWLLEAGCDCKWRADREVELLALRAVAPHRAARGGAHP